MVNLFRPLPAQQGSLTAALLALLEHADRSLLNGLLERAGIPFSASPGKDLKIAFPAPDAPPDTGLIVGPDFQIALATQQPGEDWHPEDLTDQPGVPLAISLTGQAPPGAHGLSWEQVDRWLAAAAERYDPESRTGFLIEQFRAVLPEVGITYFAGFDPELLAVAPEAQERLTQFHTIAGLLFDRLAPALAAVRPGAVQIRQARPEELLAGYNYRDYSDPVLGPTGFLRVALNLAEAQLEAICWLTPGAAHTRLGELLKGDAPALRSLLARLGHHPKLWLWSPAVEQKLPLETLEPEALANVDWGQFHAGVRTGLPFADFPREDLTGRVVGLVTALAAALAPVLSTTVH